MDGRHPEAIRLTLTNCTDRAHEAEFNKWYDTIHLPDILGSGLATQGSRFADADRESGNPSYLALYELPGTDLERINQAFADQVRRLHERSRMFPHFQIVRRSMWRRIGEHRESGQPRAKTAGLFIIESTCTSSEREREFHEWYDRIHIPDLLATELFHTAHRFRGLAGQDGGTYLAIYETSGDALEAVKEFTRNHRPKLKAAGRLSDIIDITWRGIYQRI
jgi:hypothetical protein